MRSCVSVLLVVVIATGWMTTIYSNLKEEDILIGNKEPVNIVVVTDVVSSQAHNNVMDHLFKYLKEFGGVDKIYYVRDPESGPKYSETVKSWWRRALRDPISANSPASPSDSSRGLQALRSQLSSGSNTELSQPTAPLPFNPPSYSEVMGVQYKDDPPKYSEFPQESHTVIDKT